MLLPAAAHAIVPRPQKGAAVRTHTAMRKAKPPKRDQVHRAGVDGAITLIQFISTRRQHDDRHEDGAALKDNAAQVRASFEDAEPRRQGTLTARAVELLPPHWESTHLTI